MDGQLEELLKKLFLPGEVSQDISCAYLHYFHPSILSSTPSVRCPRELQGTQIFWGGDKAER